MDTSFFATNIELVYICAKEIIDIGIYIHDINKSGNGI